MLKKIVVAAFSASLVLAIPVSLTYAQTDAAKQETAKDKRAKAAAEKKAKAAAAKEEKKKKLTAQQQKMKDCAAKWQDEKKTKNVKGRTAYNKFMSGCLKG